VPIEFGSDGFRGVIGHGLTRSTAAAVTQGVVQYALSQRPDEPHQTVPIGYDTRFLAREFAELAARLVRQAGLEPLVAHRACPSPYLSYATLHLGAEVGMQFTASHNPPAYGGIKLKSGEGGSLLPEQVELVQHYANQATAQQVAAAGPLIAPGAPASGPPPKGGPEGLGARGKAAGAGVGPGGLFDVSADYRKAVVAASGWDGDSELPLLVDCMHGTGGGIYLDVLRKRFRVIEALRTAPDPLFGGGKPEPVAANLGRLCEAALLDQHGAVGLAFDGDGDRLAVVDEQGQCLAPHEIYCLLLEHIVQTRGVPPENESGMPVVVASVSFSGLVERVAQAHGLMVYEVPVGYKHVSRAMLSLNALMGGEESGGTGFGHYLPERDALLMSLLLLHARRRAGAPLHDMVEDLYARYGRPVFVHIDKQLPASFDRAALRDRIRGLASEGTLAGDKITGLNHSDGMKLKTAGGWALVRLSGTEPLLRVYAEAESEQQAKRYAEAAIRMVGVG
jgi:phosphomannomutase